MEKFWNNTEDIGVAFSNYDGCIDVNGVVDGGVNGIVDGVVEAGVNGVVESDLHVEVVNDVVNGENIDGVAGVGVRDDNSVVDNVVIGVRNDPEIRSYQTPLIRDMLNQTPHIGDVDTPNITLSSDGSSSDSSVCGSDTNSQSSQNDNSANDLLKNIRIKNVNRLIIGTLNINFIAPKFEQLKEVIGNHLDVFTIQETKIDESFPDDQFEIEGYHKP